MERKKRLVWMATISLFLVTILSGIRAFADDKQEAIQLVEKDGSPLKASWPTVKCLRA
jgi:hypothetical protein